MDAYDELNQLHKNFLLEQANLIYNKSGLKAEDRALRDITSL